MKILSGRPRCMLVVAPHADDETIGAYGLITRMRRRGIAVRVLVVTDGAASHPGSIAWPRHRLVRERQRETRRAMHLIGIASGDIVFLGLPDGALTGIASVVRRQIASVVRRAPKPLLVIAPAAGDDHPDHRAVADAVAVRMAHVRSLGYPVWPAGRRLPGSGRLPLTAQERLAKRHAIRRYVTQTGRITDDPSGFAMTRAQIAAFSGPYETFVATAR